MKMDTTSELFLIYSVPWTIIPFLNGFREYSPNWTKFWSTLGKAPKLVPV